MQLAVSHVCNVLRSLWRVRASSSFLIVRYRRLSSANSLIWVPSVRLLLISLMYARKRRGPRTFPGVHRRGRVPGTIWLHLRERFGCGWIKRIESKGGEILLCLGRRVLLGGFHGRLCRKPLKSLGGWRLFVLCF